MNMNPIVCRRMRKRGIQIVDLAYAEEASEAKWPKGLFICRCFDVLDLAAKTVRTFFDEGELMAFLGESKKRVVSKKEPPSGGQLRVFSATHRGGHSRLL